MFLGPEYVNRVQTSFVKALTSMLGKMWIKLEKPFRTPNTFVNLAKFQPQLKSQ
jgi:hypothetical protein